MWTIMLEILCGVMAIAVSVALALMIKSFVDLDEAEKRFEELFDEKFRN